MANDVLQAVKDCDSCSRTWDTTGRHYNCLIFSPATGPLEFLSMNLLVPLHPTNSANRNVLVITDRSSKLFRGFPPKDTEGKYGGAGVGFYLDLSFWCSSVHADGQRPLVLIRVLRPGLPTRRVEQMLSHLVPHPGERSRGKIH